MTLTWEGFCEDICDLQICGDMWKGDDMMIIGFPYGVTINFDVLGAFVINGVSNLNDTSVVSMKCQHEVGWGKQERNSVR